MLKCTLRLELPWFDDFHSMMTLSAYYDDRVMQEDVRYEAWIPGTDNLKGVSGDPAEPNCSGVHFLARLFIKKQMVLFQTLMISRDGHNSMAMVGDRTSSILPPER